MISGNAQKNVLVYEPLTGGHTDMYALNFALCLKDIGHFVTLAISNKNLLNLWTNQGGAGCLIPEDFTNVVPTSNRLKANYYVVRAWVKMAAIANGFDSIFIPSIDRFVSPMIGGLIGSLFFHVDWSGMHMHTFHRFNELSYIRRIILRFIFRKSMGILTLDEFKAPLMSNDIGVPVFSIPEWVFPAQDLSISAEISKIVEKATERPTVMVLGALSRRKNIEGLCKALISIPENSRPLLVLAGNSSVKGDGCEISWIESAMKSGCDIILYRKHLHDSEFILLAAHATALFVCSLAYPFSSNVAAHGGVMGCPLLTPDHGVLFDRLMRGGTGWYAPPSDYRRIGEILMEISNHVPPAKKSVDMRIDKVKSSFSRKEANLAFSKIYSRLS